MSARGAGTGDATKQFRAVASGDAHELRHPARVEVEGMTHSEVGAGGRETRPIERTVARSQRHLLPGLGRHLRRARRQRERRRLRRVCALDAVGAGERGWCVVERWLVVVVVIFVSLDCYREFWICYNRLGRRWRCWRSKPRG